MSINTQTDKFLKASESMKVPVLAVLTQVKTAGSTSAICDSLDGWVEDSAFSFTIYEVNIDGEPIVGSETDWIGEKNNNSIQNMVLTAGIDRDYPTGSTRVMANLTAEGQNRLISGLKVAHNDDGSLKDSAIGIADGSITTEKLANSSIITNKLADSSIATPKIADNSVKDKKIDFSSIGNSYITGKLTTGDHPNGHKYSKTIPVTLPKHGTWTVVAISCMSYFFTGQAGTVWNGANVDGAGNSSLASLSDKSAFPESTAIATKTITRTSSSPNTIPVKITSTGDGGIAYKIHNTSHYSIQVIRVN